MLDYFVRLIKLLNSEQSAKQIAGALCLALVIGLTPVYSLHNLIVLFMVLFLRVNIGVFLFFWPLFSLLGLVLSPLANLAGAYLLEAPMLTPMWEAFYNTLVGRWSNFYYSGVIGGLLISLVLAAFIFPLVLYLLHHYRTRLLKKLEQLYIARIFKASRLWHLYHN